MLNAATADFDDSAIARILLCSCNRHESGSQVVESFFDLVHLLLRCVRLDRILVSYTPPLALVTKCSCRKGFVGWLSFHSLRGYL